MVTIRFTIDRIEDGVAVCTDEEGKVCDYPVYLFPEGAAEGSIVDCVFEGNDLLSATLQNAEAQQQTAANEARLHSLFSKFKKTPGQN